MGRERNVEAVDRKIKVNRPQRCDSAAGGLFLSARGGDRGKERGQRAGLPGVQSLQSSSERSRVGTAREILYSQEEAKPLATSRFAINQWATIPEKDYRSRVGTISFVYIWKIEDLPRGQNLIRS